MTFEECLKKVNRYLSKEDIDQPFLLNVQNGKDLIKVVEELGVGSKIVLHASTYCRRDEAPRLEELFHDLRTKSEDFVVKELDSFLKLLGKKKLQEYLSEVLHLSVAGHAVIVTYQCEEYLEFLSASDPRNQRLIATLDGEKQTTPKIVFSSMDTRLSLKEGSVFVEGLDNLANALETPSVQSEIYLRTSKKKSDFPHALYHIDELNSSYDLLLQRDPKTSTLDSKLGSEEQWSYALSRMEEQRVEDWFSLVKNEFGDPERLDLFFHSYFNDKEEKKRWLFFIGLKIFGAQKNECLNEAILNSTQYCDILNHLYLDILKKDVDDVDYWEYYDERKEILERISEKVVPEKKIESSRYCKLSLSKKDKEIYYLTDTSEIEKEQIFKYLSIYGAKIQREKLLTTLKKVYPKISDYLRTYNFKDELLTQYFQDYKYQKVINVILPEFEKIVLEQSKKREYNRLLPPRSAVIEKINTKDSFLYFVDALGVEFLGYIIGECRRLNLRANVMICRCEIPSITEKNKEFIDNWKPEQFISIKKIDGFKHHGEEGCDYTKTKLPLYLMKELEEIDRILGEIQQKLLNSEVKHVVMIADHGASRLAVISEKENIWKMSQSGVHSGRCCPKSDLGDIQSDFIEDAGDFWVISNYDRFKGGRKASVEVHGGTTLEEVCVPIIDLTYADSRLEVRIMSADAKEVDFKREKNDPIEIETSFRKKAAIRIFLSSEEPDVRVAINGTTFYEANLEEPGFYRVEMPDLKKGEYNLTVYSGSNILKEGILIVKSGGMRERKIL